MLTLRVPGQRESRVAPHEIEGKRAGGLLTVKPIDAFRLDISRAALGEGVTLKGLAEDALVELELEGGLRLWTSVAQLREDLPEQARRGAETGELVMPASLPFGTPSRGIGTWVVKALRIFNVELAEQTAGVIAAKLEDQLQPGPGLYRCAYADRCELRPLAPGEVPFAGDQPALLFLHGTASSTEGSFGGLWEPPQLPVLKALHERFGGNLFAYQHRSLSQSPIENALTLAKALPAGARLHLVSHSRGGLVGELLCRGSLAGRAPFDDDDLARFKGADRKRDHDLLIELNEVLKAKAFKVERFVRVACPARGTTLASGRLDRYLSIIVNAIGLIPALKGSAVYDLVTDFLLAVIKTRTKPDELPGIEAMMPESPLVAVLNRPGIKTEADLSVIAGDIEGEGLWGRLKVLATDLFYREDHDLVVNTSAMYGGAARVQGARYVFDQGPSVSHFNYFRNERTTRCLQAALTGDPDQGFNPLAPPREISRGAYRGPAGTPQPLVILIPGIMGSHLAVDGDRIWLDPIDIAVGGFGKLAIDASGVVAEAPMASAYLDLIEYLQASHEVIPFPFDWRRSILQESRRLADTLATALDRAEANGQPVRLLAHSMGGLVARALIAERPDLWQRLTRHPGGRLLMLGTPNGGSYVIPRLLLGREKIVRQLALLDFRHSQQDLLKLIAAFPGVLEMLPAEPEPDFFGKEIWQQLRAVDGEGWVPPDAAALAGAKSSRRLLDDSPIDPQRMIYVAGQAPATPVGLALDGGTIRILASARGDGRVPWATGIPAGVPTWYLPAEHGSLADHAPSFPALLELLQSGHTSRLPQMPPVALRGVEERFALPDEEIPMFPDDKELAAAALGAFRHKAESAEKHRVRVSVSHGNLRYARHPVTVGHYQGDTIISAEAYLDRVLDGRLRARNRLGLYPGPADTAEIFLNPGGKPGGAIVVGLGKTGELTPGKLSSSFSRAALMYAAAVAECDLQTGAEKKGRRSATMTTLLIGTGAGGLSVADSVAAILRGVAQANRVLVESRYGTRVLIDELEFLELYEDVAIQLARSLATLGTDGEVAEQFAIEERIVDVPGGRQRVTFAEAPGWWRRLQVLADTDGALRFSTLTDRARAEVALQPTQRALVDRFVEQSITRTDSDRQLSTTLFELLLPNRLKEQAPDRQNLVLVLNEDAARYPWELLQDRDRPLAVEAGVVRQLETAVYRENPNLTARKTALVVGDPPSDQIELPGAQKEARMVAETLGGQEFKVTSKIGRDTDADAVIKALFADGYRVLHLAGHGVYEQVVAAHSQSCDECGTAHPCPGRKVTGMVLGTGLFLTPTEIGQMRQVPELVFINCCHLGRIEGGEGFENRHKLAANLATQLIRMGVRAVVAAGWAVDDEAASLFAREFYQQMLAGTMFGQAVLAARRRIYDEYPEVNTWGAYQCYGDPDYALVPREGVIKETAKGQTYYSVSEVVSELQNIASDAYAVVAEKVEGLLQRVRLIEERLPADWLAMAAVRSALGRAYGQLDDFGPAIRHYQAALAAEPADFPVRSIEQLANLQIRWGSSLIKDGKKPAGDQPDPAALIREGKRHLELLLQLGVTVERLSLMGSACKRQATIATGEERDTALAAMIDYYRQAHELARQQTGAIDPHAVLNWLVGLQLADLRGKGRKARAVLGPWLGEVEKIADERDKQEPNFWNGILRTECLLVRHLAARDLANHSQEIVDGYLGIFHCGATPKELRSVEEHLNFIVALLDSDALRPQRQILSEVRDRLGTALK